MGLLKVIEFRLDFGNTIVQKFEYNTKKEKIDKGTILTVRENQAVVFADGNRFLDVFLPGTYELDISNLPILSKIMGWKVAFETEFKSDIYFINTKPILNQKCGNTSPITLHDDKYGLVRFRAFADYQIQIDDPYIFMMEVVGTLRTLNAKDIFDYLRSNIVVSMTEVITLAKLSINAISTNLADLSQIVERILRPEYRKYGVNIVKFTFEKIMLPDDIESKVALLKNNGIKESIDIELAVTKVLSLKNANYQVPPVHQGIPVTNIQKASDSKGIKRCNNCNAVLGEDTKFCKECGTPIGLSCPSCGKTISNNAKFCPECGMSLKRKCSSCGNEVEENDKFCKECGNRL